MNEVKNYEAVKEIASKHLGKVGGDGYSDQYNPELLVKIPRKLNREGYNLTGKEFKGVDTWEKRTRDKEEKIKGLAATAFTQTYLELDICLLMVQNTL